MGNDIQNKASLGLHALQKDGHEGESPEFSAPALLLNDATERTKPLSSPHALRSEFRLSAVPFEDVIIGDEWFFDCVSKPSGHQAQVIIRRWDYK